MKTKLLALALLGVGTMFAGPRIGESVGIGPPYPCYAPAYVAPAPVWTARPLLWSLLSPVNRPSGSGDPLRTGGSTRGSTPL
jgi:hypothetical protein